MTDPCKVEGCVQRTDRLERSLRVQKEECEERLRLQKEEYEQQEKEYVERLRVQNERSLLVRIRDYSWAGCYPLPFHRFPLEIIALIADFVHDFDDLASMALVSWHVHNGVLLSRQWIVVEELVATGTCPSDLKKLLHDRLLCAYCAYESGMLRCVRAMNLSRDEVTYQGCNLVVYGVCQYGHLDILKYLHSTYALTVQDFSLTHHAALFRYASKHFPVLKYLHSVMGFVIPRDFPLRLAAHCLEVLKLMHSAMDVHSIANPHRSGDYWVVRRAASYSTPGQDSCGDCGACAHERLVYLRDEYGITKEEARRAIHCLCLVEEQRKWIRDVFDLEE